MKLNHLTDKALLADTKKLALQERVITAQLLHHLKEVEQRRLYSEMGYPSLFKYTIKELKLSEGSAKRRIDAARLLEDLPQIDEKIRTGALNLTNISSAVQVFKEEDIQDKRTKLLILERIENTSKRECERILQEFSSRPKELTIVKAHLNDDELLQYEELKGLLAHRPQQKFWRYVFEAAIKKLKEEKFKINSSKPNSSAKRSRYISAQVKKGVYLRDKACQKCGSKYGLEYDHIVPFALGGKNTKENLRILCRSCNQRQRINQKFKY